ncbi:hypothetical protein ACFCWV_35290 [Streptomyces sp. NPDC056341]|uniref:hypothetical protein n=1 Tax=Streptomyces sp. NPDC056341 TaxID=3345788 RepID=UPI0035E293D3
MDRSTGSLNITMATSYPVCHGRSAPNPARGGSTTSSPAGEAWFANFSIDLWLRTLHHYGLHVRGSEILSDPDDREVEALAELILLADEFKRIDSSAFDGYNGFIWADGPSSSTAGSGSCSRAPCCPTR